MTYDELLESLDWAQRQWSDLRGDQENYEEGSEEWQTFIEEINEAESDVDYFQEQLDLGNFSDD